tara:strand:- start:2511 stop:2648 length:138 start_codon:yes stop_codon:yes gene_type:complete
MAKVVQLTGAYSSKKVKRKGVHAKTKMSASKSAKNYSKPYKGQGR